MDDPDGRKGIEAMPYDYGDEHEDHEDAYPWGFPWRWAVAAVVLLALVALAVV